MSRTLLLLALVGCVGDEPVEPDTDLEPLPERVEPHLDGPFPVGVTTLVVDRTGGLPPLTVEVWYPATPAPGDAPDAYEAEALGFPGHAYRDARPDPRGLAWSVVAFSHGYGGIRFQSAFLTEHLASHGFVVVAPDHAGTTLVDLDADAVATVAARRPRDVADAVDALLDPGVPGLPVDTTSYGVVGHSFGAWTALAVGGGIVDPDGFAEVCATEHPTACRFFDGHPPFDPDEVAAWLKPDPRAVVTVAISPGASYAFSPDGSGLQGVRLPLVLGGTKDGDMPFEGEILRAYQGLGSPRWLGAIEGTGHWAVSDLCAILPIEDCAGEAGGYLDPARVHDLVRTTTLAHLRARWLGVEADLPWLAATDDLAWTEE